MACQICLTNMPPVKLGTGNTTVIGTKLSHFKYIAHMLQLHAVSRSQQGRQRESSVKTLRSPLSAEFWRHCVLSGGTQRSALPRNQSENINVNKYFTSASGDRTHNQSILQSHFVSMVKNYIYYEIWIHIQKIYGKQRIRCRITLFVDEAWSQKKTSLNLYQLS